MRNTSFFTKGYGSGSAQPSFRSRTISSQHTSSMSFSEKVLPNQEGTRKRSASSTLIVDGVGQLDVLQPATLIDSEVSKIQKQIKNSYPPSHTPL